MAIKDLIPVQKHLFLCNGGTCKLNGAEETTALVRQAINNAGLQDEIHTTKTLCNGRCKDGPVVIAAPDGIWFKQITPDNASRFTDEYLENGHVPDDLVLYRYGSDVIHPVQTEKQSPEELLSIEGC